ncbi:TRAP transporter small permease subunit [Piscinibacter sakaiensis]|uniref:TRAP transporter small permease protein n=1 Tax=Piscinibacter sakaiensis TaxID=1547922 RepID=A0A0K8P443_PISS1|nr:TRAP transporter small permease subunit [Piscinibacter sakaiensis]GAP37397.1 tripartite ATP-independent periplasmic transporter, DctQ component [Piscinibacter sakaiensis]
MSPEPTRPPTRWQRAAQSLMAAMLAVMALAVFVNVVLRYGFGSGVAASEELSRLLFVWMVFLGATLAYPAGEHMAFTALVAPLRRHPRGLALLTRLIHALVTATCAMVAWGAWQQVVVGLDSRSTVLGYPVALLPLPALLASVAIGAMAAANLWRGRALDLGHGAEVE